jgi:proteasome accessory factor B
LTGEDYTISIRTFQRDVDTIRELFLIDIRYSRTEGLYYINDEFSDKVLSERLIESLDVFHSLKMMDNLSNIFHFEARPPLGTEHLNRMIFAVKNKRIITLTYNKNWENQFTERTLLPLLLKEFRGRWYIVAKRMDTEAVRIYSLDRVVGFIIQEQQATPPENLGNYFNYSFGIYVNTDPNPQEVVLKFSPDAGRYVKDAVLHHSQQVMENSAEAFVVKLYLSITFDFVMEILGYGELVEVISPPELRAQVSDRLKKAEEKYK